MSGVVADDGPIGWRVLAVMLDVPDSSTNFFHRSSCMCSPSVMSMPAA